MALCHGMQELVLVAFNYDSSLSLRAQPAGHPLAIPSHYPLSNINALAQLPTPSQAAGHPIRSLIHPSKKRTTMAVKIRAARKNVPQPLPTFFGSKKIRETNVRTYVHTALYI
jgi:hypothetical protein